MCNKNAHRRKIFLSKQKNKQTYSKSLACVTIDFSVDGKVVVKLFFRATITIFFPNKTRKPIASNILLSGKKKRSYNLNDLGLPSQTIIPPKPKQQRSKKTNTIGVIDHINWKTSILQWLISVLRTKTGPERTRLNWVRYFSYEDVCWYLRIEVMFCQHRG